MSKYMNWELYDKPPEGFSIDKHTGSPLTGYDFYTNGKSVLNGGVRILVKSLNFISRFIINTFFHVYFLSIRCIASSASHAI
jgi:hypothetical protein